MCIVGSPYFPSNFPIYRLHLATTDVVHSRAYHYRGVSFRTRLPSSNRGFPLTSLPIRLRLYCRCITAFVVNCEHSWDTFYVVVSCLTTVIPFPVISSLSRFHLFPRDTRRTTTETVILPRLQSNNRVHRRTKYFRRISACIVE